MKVFPKTLEQVRLNPRSLNRFLVVRSSKGEPKFNNPTGCFSARLCEVLSAAAVTPLPLRIVQVRGRF